MLKTYGLTHIALAVQDLDRAQAFYGQVFGMQAVYRGEGFIQLQTPGTHDVLVVEQRPADAGKTGAISHFGFRLPQPLESAPARELIQAAGGQILRHGEFVPGEPYIFALDPDGNEFEVWFEPPTALDPVPPA